MTPIVKTFFDENTFTASHIAIDPSTRQCAIIDPVLDFDQASGQTATRSADDIINYVNAEKLTVQWVLETHLHADHLTAAPYLKERLGGETVIGAHVSAVQKTFSEIFNAGKEFVADGSQFDRLVNEGDKLPLGELEISVIHTPGHTPACVVYVIGDAAFVGDTLFMPDYGSARCDFPGGDAATLYDSVQKIFALPDDTRLLMCHDYKAPGRNEFVWETTVAKERAENIHLNDQVSREQFVEMRTKRDAGLSMPKLILPSVQVNMRAGALPPAEDNGIHYLKIPLNTVS